MAFFRIITGLAVTLGMLATPIGAQPPAAAAKTVDPAAKDAPAGALLLELNNAQDTQSGACQLTVVTTNRTGQSLGRAAWQVAIFDKGGVVRSLPILDFGALQDGKTKVAIFELPAHKCGDIARIVVNDVAECTTSGNEQKPDLCLGSLSTRALGDIAFGI